ncbi:MAG: glutamate racemase, partial [Myxococcales bacterium]|nr:glutamate racemase [Myxococcales bacterium]
MTHANADAPIGVFDSGVGGLTVLAALRAALPTERFLYLGDTARVPYGTKSPATVARYAENVADVLLARGAKALVIACNTASAFGLEAVRARTGVPVVDVIGPAAADVAARPGLRRIGVLGTRGTVASMAYPRALERAGATVEIAQQPCPLFVPLAEDGWTSGPVPRQVADTYIGSLLASGPVDAVVLGCTHYP